MKNVIKTSVSAIFLIMTMSAHAENKIALDKLSMEYSVAHSLLQDFVSSYNFKCPNIINEGQLRLLLSDKYADNELNIMIESQNLDWRDTYVEARSNITCLTSGAVFKGY